jgi:hypothetical protein
MAIIKKYDKDGNECGSYTGIGSYKSLAYIANNYFYGMTLVGVIIPKTYLGMVKLVDKQFKNIRTLASTTVGYWNDVTFDGHHLYMVANPSVFPAHSNIVHIDREGNIIKIYGSDQNAKGITTDGKYFWWGRTSGGNSYLRQSYIKGNSQYVIQEISLSRNTITGLTVDGKNLWLAFNDGDGTGTIVLSDKKGNELKSFSISDDPKSVTTDGKYLYVVI